MLENPSLAAPDPLMTHPIPDWKRTVFLKSLITRPNIVVGDYSYYDDPDGAEGFEENNVLYQFREDDVLRIGRFCAFAKGTTFLMNGANHRMDGISTYPFPAFGASWGAHVDLFGSIPLRGDTVVGNDVWIGFRAIIMPGVTIGDGAIVAAGSVVTRSVPPYAIVAGNPARVVRRRFDNKTVLRLQRMAWWDWPIEQVSRHIRTLMAGDLEALEAALAEEGGAEV